MKKKTAMVVELGHPSWKRKINTLWVPWNFFFSQKIKFIVVKKWGSEKKYYKYVVIENPIRIQALFQRFVRSWTKKEIMSWDNVCACKNETWHSLISGKKKPAEEESVVAAFAKGIPSTR